MEHNLELLKAEMLVDLMAGYLDTLTAGHWVHWRVVCLAFQKVLHLETLKEQKWE